MHYNHYSALEFAMDEHFQSWVLSQDAEAAHFWQTWLRLHPEKEEEVAEARQLLLMQNFQQEAWSPQQQQALKERIEKSLENKSMPISASPEKSDPQHNMFHWLIAASVVLLIGSVGLYYILDGQEKVYTTDYGETREFVLPDGSRVNLNANSSLRFASDWQQNEHRQVWLEGEAFFQVASLKTPDQQKNIKFTVHLSELDVEVVGTAFNVNHRPGKLEVTLDEGVVDLKLTDGERMRMQAGEMVAYSEESQQLSKTRVEPEKVTAWRNQQIILEGKPLSELAGIIENYYGVSIRFESRQLAGKRYHVTLPSDNLEVVLESLELMLNVQSKRNGNEITLK
jgi:transmembrane sensor